MQKLDNMKPKLGRMSVPLRKAIGVTQASLVTVSNLEPGESLPLAIRPAIDGVDLAGWVEGNRESVERQLLAHGAILFRGFRVKKPASFQNVIKSLSGELLEYTYRSTPRHQVEGRVYTSTEYPASESIPLHNEMAYTRSWPMKVWFCCLQAARQGGETPIADSRKVLQRIPAGIRKRFAEKRVMYVRNYDEGLDLRWQEVFQTDSRCEVEQYCKDSGIDYEWKANDGLRTRQVCQSLATHPLTKEEVWFNQAHLFHITSLPETVRAGLLANFKQEDLPRNTYYGDGSPIEEGALDEIREAFRQEARVFGWEEGDVLLVDNMLTSHGRNPYQGPRQVIVGMAESHEPELS
jgi:alpha-ketoglutarate-dependent taurine dioxygenase